MIAKAASKPLRDKSLAKSSGTEIVVSHAPRQQPSQEKLQAKRRALVEQSKSIEEEVADIDISAGGAEAAFLSEYEMMLRSNALLIRKFNEQLKEKLTSRDIYALSTLMSQQREVIADLRTLTDMSQQVNMIYNQATTPFVSDVTQYITDVYYQLRKLLMETTAPKNTEFALSQLDDLIKQLGLGLQSSHQKIRLTVEQILLGGNGVEKTVNKRNKR